MQAGLWASEGLWCSSKVDPPGGWPGMGPSSGLFMNRFQRHYRPRTKQGALLQIPVKKEPSRLPSLIAEMRHGAAMRLQRSSAAHAAFAVPLTDLQGEVQQVYSPDHGPLAWTPYLESIYTPYTPHTKHGPILLTLPKQERRAQGPKLKARTLSARICPLAAKGYR